MSACRSPRCLLFSVVALFCASLTASATLPPLRIMPLGDSITEGAIGIPGGYRAPLYASLTSLGYAVDYVGTLTSNGAGSLPDSDHEGHSGWTIGMIDANIDGFLDAVADPDVILLHLGTNDANDLGTFAGAIDRLDALITKIAAKRPYAHIIVTTLLPRADDNPAIDAAIDSQFNPFVSAKVDAQAALGRRVTYLDMHAFLTTADLSDIAHPNQTGYNKMAAAWLTAVTNVVAPTGDLEAPEIVRAQALPSAQEVALTFSKPVAEATATDPDNYELSGGLAVTDAALDASQRTVTLTTDTPFSQTDYTVTVNNVTDMTSPSPLSIAPDTTVTFSSSTPRGYLNNVAESAAYTLVYSLDIGNTVNYTAIPAPYTVDNHFAIGSSFSRVAYYLELQKDGGDLTYVWASMDAFTNDTAALGVPTVQSGAVFVKSVSNLTVDSNVAGVDIGSGFTGNLEFYPYRYVYANSAGVPGASDTTCDFGDGMMTDGYYGSMQLHNTTKGKTLFAFNRWCGMGTTSPELGIGNQPTGEPDWTFSSDTYTVKTLQVLVLRDSDTTPPTLVSAQSGFTRTDITVRLSEPLAPSSVNGTCFALDNGVQVLGATLAANQRDVNLITTRQPLRDLTLTVTGLRDSAAGNPIVPGSSIVVPVPTLPAEITANIGSLATNYQLVCSLDIPVVGNFNNWPNPYYYDQRSAVGAFDRVAYYLELHDADGTHYIWTSMDAFTADAMKLGIPTVGTMFQQVVTNLDVLSNVGGIVNGTGITTGNIEFWPSNFTFANGLGLPNADANATDFDDGGADSSVGWGSMQVHNYGARQTLFAINNFNNGNTIALGIGNNPHPGTYPGWPYPDPDWAFSFNAGNFTSRKLHVLVRPVASLLPTEVVANVPAAAGYQLACTVNIPVNGYFSTSSDHYVTDLRSSIGPFARIAYYLELKTIGDPKTNFIWTSMDAFTADTTKLGVPTIGTFFKQKVTRLDVLSNVGGIVNGTGIATGNIEFWPSGYDVGNDTHIPNASDIAFDFGDAGGWGGDDGYGCMQVHNYGASQTLFAINHFNQGSKIAVGIGNNTHFTYNREDPDWTVNYNADTYERRILHVLVLPGTAPTLVAAVPSTALNSVMVTFNGPVADSAADASKFAIDNGVTVTGATQSSDKKSVCLTTTALTVGQTYTLSVTGVSDRTANRNLILDGSSISFTVQAASLPTEIASGIPELGDYTMVYKLAIPNYGNFVPYGAYYSLDQSLFPLVRTQAFDRVAYCMELVTGGVTQWAYVSMDAFTGDITKIGVPTSARGAVFQQYVNNMNVYASANAAVTTGVGIATGNIEFWASGFDANNTLGVPNALGGQVFDFGDSGGSTDPSYGSMQIHNHGDATIAGHTIMSLSRFAQGWELALGIGNNTVFTYGGGYEDPDWTLHPDATTFTTKNLYVLARWGGSTQGTLPTILGQPVGSTVFTGRPVRLYVQATGANTYQWRRNGVAIPGANQPWLEIAAAAITDAGLYDVLVFGSGSASTASSAANLRVLSRGTVMTFK